MSNELATDWNLTWVIYTEHPLAQNHPSISYHIKTDVPPWECAAGAAPRASLRAPLGAVQPAGPSVSGATAHGHVVPARRGQVGLSSGGCEWGRALQQVLAQPSAPTAGVGSLRGAVLGELTSLPSSTGALLPLACPLLQGHPWGGLHGGIITADLIAEITADCGVCRQK